MVEKHEVALAQSAGQRARLADQIEETVAELALDRVLETRHIHVRAVGRPWLLRVLPQSLGLLAERSQLCVRQMLARPPRVRRAAWGRAEGVSDLPCGPEVSACRARSGPLRHVTDLKDEILLLAPDALVL